MTKRIVLFGVTGTIGRATAQTLIAQGFDVVAPVRPGGNSVTLPPCETPIWTDNLAEIMEDADAIITCIASRTGTPKDSWTVDYALNHDILFHAIAAKVPQFVMLSAICVQKPLLEFQKAKLKFEGELQSAPITWSIVRPTAFFKSLSGQVGRVQNGKPFMVFGDGMLTRCKPISDRDLAAFIVSCLSDPQKANQILPIGGPGPALTPLDQVAILESLLNVRPTVKYVPAGLLKWISRILQILPGQKTKAALARIGHYYATESMLVWDGQQYDADATPEFGTDTLTDHYRALITGQADNERGSHAVF